MVPHHLDGSTGPAPRAPVGDLDAAKKVISWIDSVKFGFPWDGGSDAMVAGKPGDAQGIAKAELRGIVYYNGVTLAQVGMRAFADYERTGDPKFLARALRHADKYAELCVRAGRGSLVFPYPIDNPRFGAVKYKWTSGMAQGLALSLMIRAHLHTGRASYLEAAHAIFASLTIDVDEGGVLGQWGDGMPWIEEVAQPGEPGSKILNGFLFALVGISEYAAYTDSKDAWRLLQQCLHSARQHISEFDYGWWSTYDQIGGFAQHYNAIHSLQLLQCYEYTGDPVFLRYALKFASYAYTPRLSASLIEGDSEAMADGYGVENLDLPGKKERKYLSYKGTMPVTLQLDLQRQYHLMGLRLIARAERSVPTSYSISASLDGIHWERLAHREGDSLLKKENVFYREPLCRYVRVTIERGRADTETSGWFALHSIQPVVRVPAAASGYGASPYVHSLETLTKPAVRRVRQSESVAQVRNLRPVERAHRAPTAFRRRRGSVTPPYRDRAEGFVRVS